MIFRAATSLVSIFLLAPILLSVDGWGAGASLLRSAHAAGQYTLSGKIVKVSDGDTVNILVKQQTHRIRLASIDAPETAHGSNRPG